MVDEINEKSIKSVAMTWASKVTWDRTEFWAQAPNSNLRSTQYDSPDFLRKENSGVLVTCVLVYMPWQKTGDV